MVSEIKGSIPSQITGVERNKPQVDASDKTAAVSPTKVSSETVTLTDFASRVEELTKSVENLPVADAEKVARLRDEIASGSYRVAAAVRHGLRAAYSRCQRRALGSILSTRITR